MLRGLLDRLGCRPVFPAVAPAQAFCAIGDVHGCADLLALALEQAKDRPIVCVGDYIDRGDNSDEVLRMLFARQDVVCLSGNHEEMMLHFIDMPEVHGGRWLRYGGTKTLASFGIDDVDENSATATMLSARDRLVAAMGQPMLEWLRSLPVIWQSGNVAVVHAGANPHVDIQSQSNADLHWGHPDFHKRMRRDGVWVLHGHTIVDAPQIGNGRIAIDTGAYATGQLTLAHVDAGGITFETLR